MDVNKMHDHVLMLPTLENKLDFLQKEIQKAEAEVSSLLRQYEQESRDVERIQKESFSTFLLKSIGKYEDRLEKEQREEINAKLAYDRATVRLDALVRAKDELVSRITILRAEERAYQTELANRRRELSNQLTEPQGIRYTELENEKSRIVSQMTEINEALKAAGRAKSTAQSAQESLKSAEGWATFDAFTRGGLISHMAKYSHIDNAEKLFDVLSSQLSTLKTELGDVHGLQMSGLNDISSAQRTIDFWFDNIFTDLSVRSQIIDNAEQINRLITNINKVESTLRSKLSESEADFEKNKRQEEELLLSLR